MRRAKTAVMFLLGAAAIAGYADDASTVSAGAPGASAQVLYEVDATVLESPEHGPQLCSGTLDSLPPQCSGLAISGWDWAAVEGEESANGTTWGEFHVVGTWDGTTFTVAGPVTAPEPGEFAGPDFTSSCPVPELARAGLTSYPRGSRITTGISRVVFCS